MRFKRALDVCVGALLAVTSILPIPVDFAYLCCMLGLTEMALAYARLEEEEFKVPHSELVDLVNKIKAIMAAQNEKSETFNVIEEIRHTLAKSHIGIK